MSARRLAVSASVLCSVALVGCELISAGFGAPCDGDVDCTGEASAPLQCVEGRCVTQAFVDAKREPPPGVVRGETCGNAIPLELGVRVEGTTGAALNDHTAACAGPHGDIAYVVQLPATTNLRVVLESAFDGVVYASEDDDCTTIIAGACEDAQKNVVDPEELLLPGVGPGTIFIVVDGADQQVLPTSGTYALTVREDVGCPTGFVGVKGACIGTQKEVAQVVDRTNATATLLDDNQVLVVGGRTGADLTTTNTAEVFDPITDTFTATGSMRQDRARHSAERLQDGRVLVMGGVRGSDGTYTPTNSVEVWDPESGTWSDGPALPRRRDLFTATQLDNGRGVLVVGGRDGATTLNDILIIDPGLTAWTPHGTLVEPRFGHIALLIDNGDEVLIVGGRTGSAAEALSSVESFDPRGNTLSAGVSLPDARAAAVGVALDQQHVAIFGGYEGSFDAEILGKASSVTYSVAQESWSDVFDDMLEPRLFASANVVPGLGVIVAGGSQDAPTASVELFDDGEETFQTLPSLKHARLAHVAVTLADRRVLIVGGDGGDEFTTVPLATAELIGPPL